MVAWKSSLFFKKAEPEKFLQETSITASTSTCLRVMSPLSISYEKQPLSVLKKLAPIRDLPDDDILQMEQHSVSYAKESVVFALGEKSEYIYYLIKGSVELKPDGGISYVINESSTLANLPLNGGRVCGAMAITKEPSVFLSVPMTVVQWWVNKSRSQKLANSLQIIDIELPSEVPNTHFFRSFAQAYRENKLSLPLLPQVANQLRKAMEKENLGVKEVISIVQIDPPIVAKLIQVSNSALYASSTPIKNCHDAVTRLGLETTRKLVIGMSIKQLFRCNSPQLTLKMQELWKKSLHISSLSFVLAQESGEVNPEDALLAGLICDIGAIPLIHFAEQHPENHPDLNDLQTAMPYLNPPVGSLILHSLGFSNEMTEIPRFSEDWYYESNSENLTLIDIVILAKLHSYLGTTSTKKLPYICSIPAYNKLRNGKLNSDFSLDILVKAQQRIDIAMSMFG